MVKSRAVLCLVGLAGCVIDESYSTSEQESIAFSSNVLSMSPVAYYRMGEMTGSLMWDSGPMFHNGVYRTVRLGTAGAIAGDPDRAVFFGGNESSSAEVPDHYAQSLTRAWDTFACYSAGGCRGWGLSGEARRDPHAPAWERQLSPVTSAFDDPHFGVVQGFGQPHTPSAWIDTRNSRTDFQQGLALDLPDGDMQIRVLWTRHAVGGPLQPVSLIARRKDKDNYVRAELTETTSRKLQLRLIHTVDGVDRELAVNPAVGTYKGGWWHVRFKFEGVTLQARAWQHGEPQHTSFWHVQTEYTSTAQGGGIAVRASNKDSSARPIFHFTDFWAQVPGLTISLFVKPEGFQPTLADKGYVNFWGKASRFDSWDLESNDGNSEYEFRYTPPKPATNGEPAQPGKLKGYIFNLSGGLGAGQNVDNIMSGNWYHLVLQFDSGDALDPDAGVTMYVNGSLDRDGLGNLVEPRVPHSGSKYNGASHCDADGKAPLHGPNPALPGRCRNNECKRYSDGQTSSCWALYPGQGDSPIRFATVQNEGHFGRDSGWFAGVIDEVAIFERKLREHEVLSLYNTSK